MRRDGKICPDLRHAEAAVDPGKMHPLRQQRRAVLQSQAVSRAIWHSFLHFQLGTSRQFTVNIHSLYFLMFFV